MFRESEKDTLQAIPHVDNLVIIRYEISSDTPVIVQSERDLVVVSETDGDNDQITVDAIAHT
ncbi:hypothetical protein [Bifidobacterium sp. UTBIF-68]|uniref:hypothetical protein n=1 Tax=Bifidobacterium sp. UTBIF-68 TaxID=1465262 RepID=UPI00112BAFEA|nr:hypothetical protein [Bifidobacterium sp. UTBIF-68]